MYFSVRDRMKMFYPMDERGPGGPRYSRPGGATFPKGTFSYGQRTRKQLHLRHPFDRLRGGFKAAPCHNLDLCAGSLTHG
jgi:hypothetical protein